MSEVVHPEETIKRKSIFRSKVILFFPEGRNIRGGAVRSIFESLRSAENFGDYKILWVTKKRNQRRAVRSIDQSLTAISVKSKRLEAYLTCASCIVNESNYMFSHKKRKGQTIFQFPSEEYIKAGKKSSSLNQIDYFVGDPVFLEYIKYQHGIEDRRLLRWDYESMEIFRPQDPEEEPEDEAEDQEELEEEGLPQQDNEGLNGSDGQLPSRTLLDSRIVTDEYLKKIIDYLSSCDEKEKIRIRRTQIFLWNDRLAELKNRFENFGSPKSWAEWQYSDASVVLLGNVNKAPYWVNICKTIVPVGTEPTIREYMIQSMSAKTDLPDPADCTDQFILKAMESKVRKFGPCLYLTAVNKGLWLRSRLKSGIINAKTKVKKRLRLEARRAICIAQYAKGVFLTGDARNDSKILFYKNRHKGERCFLIGNGPSLTPEDLNKIKGEITFGCNKVFKIFDETEWRPTYFCMIDALIAKYSSADLSEFVHCPLFTNRSTIRLMTRKADHCVVMNNLGESKYRVSGNIGMYYIPSGATVMTVMFELAAYMGFSEICLIGVDCTSSLNVQGHGIKGYVNQDMIKKDIERVRRREKNFSMTEEDVARYYFEKSMSSYYVIRDYAEKKGIKVINATRGGMLEAFERKNLEDILASPKPSEA